MKIVFLGDIALIGKYDLTKDRDALSRLDILAKELKKYDYVIANLESPFTERKNSIIPKSMHLRTSPENINILKYLNINAVSLANNHTYDFGRHGLIDTIKVLDQNEMEWFGADNKYLLKEISGEKISVSGFCCLSSNGFGYIKKNGKTGINTLTYENISNQLELDRKNRALSILSFHWGQEHTNYPAIEQILLSKRISRENNVIIHGHHPHVVQGIAEYNQSLIAYSLGNCLFDDCISINNRFSFRQNAENKKSFILEIEVANSIITSYRIIGYRELDGRIELFDIDDKIRKISNFLKDFSEGKEYEKLRKEQIRTTLQQKFGKRDLKWLVSRLNYYSIGAKIVGILRKNEYLKEIAEWKK